MNKPLDEIILVTDTGFAPYDEAPSNSAYHLSVDEALEAVIKQVLATQEVHIPFASSADGRGFSVARALRDYGYQGRIYATGALVCDHYRHARQSGFDGVLLTKAQATKMPEPHWLEQAQRVCLTYRDQIYA